MELKWTVRGMVVAGAVLMSMSTGCATHEAYHGPISTYFSRGAMAKLGQPLPIQAVVKVTGEDPKTTMDLAAVFINNLKASGKFADVIPVGGPANPSLKRVEMDVDLKMLVSNKTSPLYVISWGCIFPMFIPGNKITSEGHMTVAVSDGSSTLKTYVSDKTVTQGRNSVGLAYVRIETRTMERWSRPTLEALFDDMIGQIVQDNETYQRFAAHPAP